MKLFEKATRVKEKENNEERIEMLKEVVDRQDDFGAAYEALVRAFIQTGKKRPRISQTNACGNANWIELCRRSAEAHYILGALAFISGDASTALVEF